MKRKDFLIILVPSFIITILWVVFSIYHNLTTSTIIDPLTIQIIPIGGSFDEKSIQNIKNRQKVDPLFEFEAVPELNPTPMPSPAPEATPSAIPTGIETPVPTEAIIP